MRILIVTNLYPNAAQPQRGVWNRDQFTALATRHQVRIIAPVSWLSVWRARLQRQSPPANTNWIDRNGVPVAYPTFYYPPGIQRRRHGRYLLRSIQRVFRKAVKDFKPHVLLASWAYPEGWAAVRLGQSHGLPVVIQTHGSDINRLSARAELRNVTADALTRADQIVTVSQALAEKTVQLGVAPDKVQTVYLGIDRNRFQSASKTHAAKRLGLRGDRPLLLFVGSLAPAKGVDVLIEACAALRDQGEQYRCVIVGAGPLRKKLAAGVRRRRLTEQIAFAGPRPHAELVHWYNAADLLALPSRTEGLPIVVREALACGTPVVASNVGGLPEISAPGLLHLVPPDDATALASTIRNVLTASRDRPRYAVPQPNHQDAAEELSRLLESIVERNGSDELAAQCNMLQPA